MSDDMLDQRTRHRLEDLQDIVKQDAKLIQNLRREIEKLRARSVLIPESVQKIIDDYPAVCAQRDRMREALEPFAKLKPVAWSLENDHYFIATDDICRARTAANTGDR